MKFILANGLIQKEKVLEKIIGQMGLIMKVNGKTINLMVLVEKLTPKEQAMKESLKMDCHMVREFKSEKIKVGMKVTFKMERSKVRE